MKKELSVYIHIPFCLSKCDYCDFFSQPCNEISDLYVKSLCNEIKVRLKKTTEFDADTVISTIYIGGGTPSLLRNDQFTKIVETLKKSVQLSENFEFTVEVNPDDVSESLLSNFEKNGVNRISCGIQSLNDESLKCVNRRGNKIQNIKALELLKKIWNFKLSLDLIAGLPYETEKSFIEGIKSVISYNPDHISMYTLTVEEETPLYKKIESEIIPYDFDFSDKLWLEGRKILIEHGYNHYEISNFSKNGFECKHNMSYWQRKDYLGFGCGGTGTLYNKEIGFRWTNKTNLKKYIDFWKNESFVLDNSFFNLNLFFENKDLFFQRQTDFSEIQETELIEKNDSVFEFFMMGLRTKNGVNSTDFENIFSRKMDDKFIKLINDWQKKGLAEIKKADSNTNYSLNSKGILFLNAFLEKLIE